MVHASKLALGTGSEDSVTIQDRLAELDRKAIEASLWQQGYAKTDALLTAEQCDALVGLYDKDQLFRSRIDMKRFRFGEGEYKYFTYPLPPLVQTLREHIYPRLAGDRQCLGKGTWVSRIMFPLSHDKLLAVCRRNGQAKPTPLLLRYAAGDYNCLHQDLYGAVAFRCSSPPSSVGLTSIFPVVSFCSWNNDRGHNHAVRSWPRSRVKS